MTLDIHLGVVFLWAIAALLAWAAIQALDDWENFAPLILACMSFAAGFWGYHEAKPEIAAKRAEEVRQRMAKEEADKQPRVVREADGCKVYAFKAGDRWHYFARCPNAHTVTDTAYEQCTGSGKFRSCKEVYSSIETK